MSVSLKTAMSAPAGCSVRTRAALLARVAAYLIPVWKLGPTRPRPLRVGLLGASDKPGIEKEIYGFVSPLLMGERMDQKQAPSCV